MAEGFEPYHVPQQSRRDKLRVLVQNQPNSFQNLHNLHGCAGLLPLYDPSLLPHNLLTCTVVDDGGGGESPVSVVKEEAVNLMRYVNASSSSSATHHPYMDPLNPSSIQDINNHPFLYTNQNHRDFDHQSFNGGSDASAFKPEPLSLSLSSHNVHTQNTNLPLELNLQNYEPATAIFNEKVSTAGGGSGRGGGDAGGYMMIGGGRCSSSNEGARNFVPLGPFTGYSTILKGSRFLKPAQQLLDDFCDVGTGTYAHKIAAEPETMDDGLSVSGIVDDSGSCGDGGGENRGRKSRLISMLDELYRRYKQYYQQMQAVVASFESVAGLGNAAPYANLALKAMSKHFRCLKNAITDQLQFTSKAQGHVSYGKDESPRFGNSTEQSLYSQRPIHNSGYMEHHQPVWRPQRGLPERAVTVLRAWLFEHFLHPYPTDTDKIMLAKQTGLSRSQVSNWFINARVRLWKPMVEEIHMLETRQTQNASQREDDRLPSTNSNIGSENHPSTSTAHNNQDPPSKRTRNELLGMPPIASGDEPMSIPYNNLSSHAQHMGIDVGSSGGTSNVSLTLGLYQNNGIGLSEPFPINAAPRFGLDPSSEGFIVGGFESQNRLFSRDIIGGQLLHDFVG